jgi:ammonia channel protein AmtB
MQAETLFQTKMRLGVVPESIKTSIAIGLHGGGGVFGDIAVTVFSSCSDRDILTGTWVSCGTGFVTEIFK